MYCARVGNGVGRTYGQKEVNDMLMAKWNQMLNDGGHIPLNPDQQLN